MVALRKDVKVGLTIGAIAVSVIGVYAGLSALAGDKPADASTAKLEVTPMDGRRDPNAGKAVADRTPRADPRATPPATGGGTASATPPSGVGAANPPTEANPADPTNAKAGEDPWAVAFGSGNIQPKKTVSPTPGTKSDVAADRESTIKSINGDPKADPKLATATAGDTSGSMNVGGNDAELTRNGSAGLGNAAPNTTGTATGAAGQTATTSGAEKSHTVEPGETFSSISNEHYGNSKHFDLIIRANPQVNPNKLKPGTVIKIPELAKREQPSDTVDVPAAGGAAATIDASKQYVVKPGDSLHKIASTLWNDSAQSAKLYELNKGVIGADPTRLKPGMVLSLPTAPTQTTAAR